MHSERSGFPVRLCGGFGFCPSYGGTSGRRNGSIRIRGWSIAFDGALTLFVGVLLRHAFEAWLIALRILDFVLDRVKAHSSFLHSILY